MRLLTSRRGEMTTMMGRQGQEGGRGERSTGYAKQRPLGKTIIKAGKCDRRQLHWLYDACGHGLAN